MPESVWAAPLALTVVTLIALKIFSLAYPRKPSR